MKKYLLVSEYGDNDDFNKKFFCGMVRGSRRMGGEEVKLVCINNFFFWRKLGL